MIKGIVLIHAYRPTSSRLFSQVIVDCVKLTIKTKLTITYSVKSLSSNQNEFAFTLIACLSSLLDSVKQNQGTK